jgi:hypothetical protein
MFPKVRARTTDAGVLSVEMYICRKHPLQRHWMKQDREAVLSWGDGRSSVVRDVVSRLCARGSTCGQTWREFLLLHVRDFFSTALSIRSSSSFPPQICSNHEAAAAHEQMVDLTTASSTSEFYKYQSCCAVPVKIYSDEIRIVIPVSILRSIFFCYLKTILLANFLWFLVLSGRIFFFVLATS